jgi:L-lactate dehydrogenase complex protein LldG
MTDARDDILNNIRKALGDALLPEAAAERPENRTPRDSGGLERFADEARELSAEVVCVSTAQEAAEVVAALCRERGWGSALAWPWDLIGVEGLAAALAGAGVSVQHEGDPQALEPTPVGITGAEAGIADTGTIVVRSGEGRSRLASLLPPVHVALLDAARIVPEMRAYFEALEVRGGAGADVQSTGNLVFISGPSRTADIEQTLTLGVHGPRELIIVVYGE